jgi:hypothetical protein
MNGERNISNKSRIYEIRVFRKNLSNLNNLSEQAIWMYTTEIFGKKTTWKPQKILDEDTHEISAQNLPADYAEFCYPVIP